MLHITTCGFKKHRLAIFYDKQSATLNSYI